MGLQSLLPQPPWPLPFGISGVEEKNLGDPRTQGPARNKRHPSAGRSTRGDCSLFKGNHGVWPESRKWVHAGESKNRAVVVWGLAR